MMGTDQKKKKKKGSQKAKNRAELTVHNSAVPVLYVPGRYTYLTFPPPSHPRRF